MERTKTARETGVWWAIPYWRDEKYYKDNFASRESVEIAFCELIQTFNAKWLLDQKTNGNAPFVHLIAAHLMAEGLMPFQFLYDIGIDLHTVRSENLVGDIERRLKSSKEYLEAALFELKFLARLLRNGYKIERDHPSGKGKHNCDLKASRNPDTVFIEIKRPWQLSAQNREIANEAHSRFISKLLTDDIKNEDDITSSPLSSCAEANKVFSIVRKAANDQLPKTGPGIIVVASPLALNWNEFETIAQERFQGRKKYPSLSAVVLIESRFHEGQIRHNSHIIYNPIAKIDVKTIPLMEFFRNL